VAIARALARAPSVLLLDEPFSGLDGVLKEAVRSALLDDLRRLGATVLVVTHDPEEAMAIADDLFLMSDGRILQAGSPEVLYRQPVGLVAARLLGEMVDIPGMAVAGRVETVLGALAAPGVNDGPVRVGLRPEALQPAGDGAAVRVLARRFAGDGYRLTLDLGGVAASLRWRQAAPAAGETVRVRLDPAGAVVFGDAGEPQVSERLP
jgi:iron(III) transport system ATP-binding protein